MKTTGITIKLCRQLLQSQKSDMNPILAQIT